MKLKSSDDEEDQDESFIVAHLSTIKFQMLASLENKHINFKKS